MISTFLALPHLLRGTIMPPIAPANCNEVLSFPSGMFSKELGGSVGDRAFSLLDGFIVTFSFLNYN